MFTKHQTTLWALVVKTFLGGLLVNLPVAQAANELVIDETGDVGIGTANPLYKMHILSNSSGAGTELTVENTNATPKAARLNFINSNNEWNFRLGSAGNFVINDPSDGVQEFNVTPSGDLTIEGNFFALGGTKLNVPDYVFDPDYTLMPLKHLETFIEKNKHLPNVPSKEDIKASGKLNMTEMQLKLLEKVEELTLYTIQQEKTINELKERLAILEKKRAVNQ